MIKRALEIIIFLSVFFTFNLEILQYWDNSLTFISVETVELGGYLGTKSYFNFDVYKYLSNLSQTMTFQSLWTNFTNVPKGNFGLDMPHNIILLTNWIIYFINITLTFPRLLLYPARMIFALIGINIYTVDAPITIMIRTIVDLTIPYIPL